MEVLEIIVTESEFFQEQYENAVREILLDVIKQLSGSLKIESLALLVIPSEFGEEILTFQEEHGLQERGHTDNAFGTAMGKVLGYEEDGHKKYALFFHKCIAAQLFMEGEEGRNMAIHLLHHELCHIHDYQMKNNIIEEAAITEKRGELPAILHNHADIIWSEYIVCRLSISTIFEGCNFNIPFLLELIDGVKEGIETEILRYRVHRDIDALFLKTQEGTSLLLRIAGSVLGYAHGLGCSEDVDRVGERISDKYFSDTWRLLAEELQALYNLYPHWGGVDVYENLAQVVLGCWNRLGIFPAMTKEGLYVDVTF